MDGHTPVTMADVARAAGVHASTVSLALRRSPRIADETRERVEAAARRLGYHPNPLVTALMKNRRNPRAGRVALTAGYLSFEALSPVLREEPVYAEFERGAFAEAKRQGMLLEKFAVSRNLTTARIDSMLSARGVNGLIIAPLPPEMKTFEMNWSGYSLIAIGPTLREPALHQVMANHFENMRLLLHACAEWGYKRPGLCLDAPSDERIGGQWEACYLREQMNHPLLKCVTVFQYTDLNPQKLHAWIKKARPDIILCLSTKRVLDGLKHLGLRVPEDIAVASVCAARPSGWLSGIVEDGYCTGSQAVSQLLRMIYGNETGIPESPIKILLPSRIHRGASTP